MPPLSQTEIAALLAGKVGEEKTLLYAPNWKKIFAKKRWGIISVEEQGYLDTEVDTLCSLIDDYQISKTRIIPQEVWEYIEEIQIFAMNIRKEDSGLGFSKTAQAKIFTKICSHSFDIAVTCMVPNSLGPAELLHHKGTLTQKARWLPNLALGKTIPAFALTEPTAGSDAGSMESTGIVYRGADGKPWVRLNWSKRYITLGPIADLLGLAVKIFDPDLILSKGPELGITVLLIPINEETKAGGVSIGRYHDPLGLAFPNGPNFGKDVCLPLDEYVIGGLSQIGCGWEMLMECLNVGRSVSLPACSNGGAKKAVLAVGAYAGIRRQFNTAIGNFGGIEEFLGKMVGLSHLIESTLYAGTDLIGEGGSSPLLSAIAKYHCTQKLEEVVICGMEVLGGKGIILGPKNFLANIYSSLKVATTVEGANILTRNMIIFGQGFIRCHPWLVSEIKALEIKNEKEALEAFDHALVGHVGYFCKSFLRAVFYGFGGAVLSPTPTKDKMMRKYYRRMNRMSSALALVSEVTLMTLGGRLKVEERISARLGDVLSYLYQGGAVLKRHEDVGWSGEEFLVEWSLQYSLNEMQNALVGVLENFPLHFVSTLLKCIIFPFGKPYTSPSDVLEKKLAHCVMEETPVRKNIEQSIYIPPLDNLKENMALLTVALREVTAITLVEKKMSEARKSKAIAHSKDFSTALSKGIISQEEFDALLRVDNLRARVIAVDDFEKLS